MNAIETHGLVKAYRDKRALDGLDMHVPKGSIYGFIGKNGAGKSTLMKVAGGMVAATSGELSLLGEPSGDERAAQHIGLLIESPGLHPKASAYDNLMTKALACGIPDPKSEIARVISLVGLEGSEKRAAGGYSLGMKQRLGLALALMGSPDLLLLDEPLNGLDPEASRSIRLLLAKLNAELGVTIVISSHVIDQLDRLVTYYGVIANGRMVREMAATEVHAECREAQQVRTTDPVATAGALRSRFPEVAVREAPDGLLLVEGDLSRADLAAFLHGQEPIVLELASHKRDIEDYFLGLMERGAQHA